jgi:hypothetical protein
MTQPVTEALSTATQTVLTELDYVDLSDIMIVLLRKPFDGSALPDGCSAPDPDAVTVFLRSGNTKLHDMSRLVACARAAVTDPLGAPALGWMGGFFALHDVLAGASGYQTIENLIPAGGNLLSSEHNFDRISFRGMPGGTAGDPNGEDFFHAMVVIAPPGTVVSCFNDRDHNDGQGRLDITVGAAGYVVIPNRGTIDNGPVLPDGQATVARRPSGGYLLVTAQMSWPAGGHDIHGFAGEMSSLLVDTARSVPATVPGGGTRLDPSNLSSVLGLVTGLIPGPQPSGNGGGNDGNAVDQVTGLVGGLAGGLTGVIGKAGRSKLAAPAAAPAAPAEAAPAVAEPITKVASRLLS